jgi:predicted phage tail protein
LPVATQWQIRIARTTPDVPVGDTTEQNDLIWQTISPIVERRFRYPNSALLYIEFDSQLFKSQPSVTVKLRGSICRIPSNYDPVNRTYSGIWNGTFTRAWTNNPAWIILELLTNTRFGAGNNIDVDKVDKWSLYKIAQYCDGTVSNGLGGTEPRFTYNAYLNTKVDAFQQVSSILSQIRGLAYAAGGQILFSQDRPGTFPVDIYTDANTVCAYDDDGILTQPNFTYDYVSLREKHSKCHVYWYDQKDTGKKKPAYVDLFDVGYGADLRRYGDEVKEIDLPGCTSEAEARRHGRWLLLTERENSKTVTFATGDSATFRYPGDLISVLDSSETTVRSAGRIVQSTVNTVTLDSPVLHNAANPALLVLMVEGLQEIKNITNPTGTYSTLSVTPPFSTPPPAGTIWALNNQAGIETYKIVSISNPETGKYGIIGVLYSDKFNAIDSNETLTSVSDSRTPPESPAVVLITPFTGGYQVGWSRSNSLAVVQYGLEYQEISSGIWQPVPLSSGVTDVEVATVPGQYRFRVRAIDLYGKVSAWKTSSFV